MPNDSAVLDEVFHALADPSRRHMLERLSHGPASVSELAEPLSMSLAAVLQHVQILERSGLVGSRKAGRVRICRLEPALLKKAEGWAARRRDDWEARLDRLGEYLDAEDANKDEKETPPSGPSNSLRGESSPR